MKFVSNLRAPKLAQAMDMYASNFHIICEGLSGAMERVVFGGTPGVEANKK
jgi:hypothetical protein